MKKPKSNAGRPRHGTDPKTSNLHIRIEPKRLKKYHGMAHLCHRHLSTWVIETLDRAVLESL